ncbi:MAG: type II toxin-antitoxin system RelE/ParE family toxin [Verrucomicrobiota bacterium]
MIVDYHPAIAAELEEIRDHYEAQSAGLGSDFVDEFEKQILRIAAMPTRWMIVRGDIRRALMRHFPYVVFFRIVGVDHLCVTVVKHEKRYPAFGLFRR